MDFTITAKIDDDQIEILTRTIDEADARGFTKDWKNVCAEFNADRTMITIYKNIMNNGIWEKDMTETISVGVEYGDS